MSKCLLGVVLIRFLFSVLVSNPLYWFTAWTNVPGLKSGIFVWTPLFDIKIESDVTKTDWADFAADSRYDFENLGCYEGGAYYATGIYRPTENSIMRCTNNYFNVISRVMIYKRSMDIAYGNSWKFDYEDFVKFDLEKAKAAYQEDKKRYNYSKRFSDQPCFEKMETSR